MIIWAYYRCSQCGRYASTFYNPQTHKILTAGSLAGKPRQCRGRYRPIPPTPIEVPV
jgi:hypothetical protein